MYTEKMKLCEGCNCEGNVRGDGGYGVSFLVTNVYCEMPGAFLFVENAGMRSQKRTLLVQNLASSKFHR